MIGPISELIPSMKKRNKKHGFPLFQTRVSAQPIRKTTMTNETSAQLARGLAAAIAAAAEAANLPKLERMKQHRKSLRTIGFYQGLDGVAEYKLQFPEAETIRVDVSTVAYSPKPAGYSEYLVNLAERWLGSSIAAAASNRADVEQLNERFGTAFPPGKHFSEPLSTGRRKKIKVMFAKHGFPLDITKAGTMSKVRGLAKATKALTSLERRVCNAGVIDGTLLVMGNQHFPIERNGNRDCIRVTINGKRRRFYLDELEWLAALLAKDWADPLMTTTVRSMGELAYEAPAPDLAPPGGEEISELACTEISEPIVAVVDPDRDPLEVTADELRMFAETGKVLNYG